MPSNSKKLAPAGAKDRRPATVARGDVAAAALETLANPATSRRYSWQEARAPGASGGTRRPPRAERGGRRRACRAAPRPPRPPRQKALPPALVVDAPGRPRPARRQRQRSRASKLSRWRRCGGRRPRRDPRQRDDQRRSRCGNLRPSSPAGAVMPDVRLIKRHGARRSAVAPAGASTTCIGFRPESGGDIVQAADKAVIAERAGGRSAPRSGLAPAFTASSRARRSANRCSGRA